MAASFGSNIHSLRALRGLNASTDRLARINERLASGARINRASDDAAGLSVSSLLNSNARVFNQGVKNINDGISALQVADGALDALSTLVLRQRELAAQSANGVFSHRQRLVLNAEANELAKEFNRIVQGTRFNGLNLLESRASYRVQAGFGVEGSIGVDLAEKISRTVGDFTFEDVVTYGNVTRSDGGVVLGDFDNDGDLDVMSTADVTNSSMYFSKNKGDGTFEDGIAIHLGGDSALSITAGDINGDGNLDVVVGHGLSMRYSVVLGNGDGTFKSAVQYQAGLGVRGVTLADMNSDGNLDMVMVNHTEGSIAVSFGDGTGSFSGYTDYHGLTTKSAYNISLGDVDGDGHLDVLVSQNDDKLALFRGSASGALGPMERIAAPSAVREAHLVDVNGDGHLDIVAGVYSTGSAGVSFGKGDGTFGTFSQVGSGFGQVQEMIVQDLDGDGLVDVAITTLDDKTVDLLKGNGDGTFQSPTTIDIGLDGARRIAAGDLNGDGALDIVVGIDGPGAADPMAVFIANTREYSLMPRLDLTTKESARSTLDFLDLISELVSSERGQIGAALSRFEYAGNVLEAMNSNSHTAASRIVDADIAFESAAAVRERILQQSATAVLSQANQAPALALRLLDI